MNWYNRIIESQEWSVEKKRRMPETHQQLYDYFHSDDPPFVKEDYMDYKAKDFGRPPDEMSYQEKASILYPEVEDRSENDHRIDHVIDFIKSKEKEVNMKLISKYWRMFPNFPQYYILNYIKKNYELV